MKRTHIIVILLSRFDLVVAKLHDLVDAQVIFSRQYLCIQGSAAAILKDLHRVHVKSRQPCLRRP